MTTETTYRIIRYGKHQFLQYLKTYRFFFFFKYLKWEPVPYPSPQGEPQSVCTLYPKQSEYSQNVKKFILKYPNIDEYFKTEFLERKKVRKASERR